MSAQRTPIWKRGPAARLLSRPCGLWRVPHGIGVPGHFAFVPYRVLSRASVMDGYSAKATGSAG